MSEQQRIIRLLQEQLLLHKKTIANYEQRDQRQCKQIDDLTTQVDSLSRLVDKKDDLLLQKDMMLDKAYREIRSLNKCLYNKSEKVIPSEKRSSQPDTDGNLHKSQEQDKAGVTQEADNAEQVNNIQEADNAEQANGIQESEAESCISKAKKRGNNNVKRKEHFGIEVVEHDEYPTTEGFDKEHAQFIKTETSIRYEYVPPKFIKHLYHRHYYRIGETVAYGKAPAAPLSGSNYDSSFIAGMLQLRYGYSLPVERIIKYFHENGFTIKKATAHNLIKQVYYMFDKLDVVLKEAILAQDYICLDETYTTVLVARPKSKSKKKSSKAYIWGAVPVHIKLIHFFYDNGSRARPVLTGYITPSYNGACQSDGYVVYEIFETDEYPGVIRLGCMQHCKRKFLEIENPDAKLIVDIMNELYQMEHKMPPDASPQVKLEHKQRLGAPIFNRLEKELIRIQAQEAHQPKSGLSIATNYVLSELPALRNYLRRADYRLDNNIIERENRSIALMRKNSLFFGSHEGAKRGLLFQSLISSCKMNHINTFEYITDLLKKFTTLPSNVDHEILRELLPDRWKKAET
jgi:hypothetical protein